MKDEVRKYTNKLISIIEEERELTDLEIGLLFWLSDDEVREFAEANEYFLDDEEEDEEEDEDEEN